MSSSDKNTNGSDLSQIRNTEVLRSNLQNISSILNTGLTPEVLDICIQLIEAGVHPQALANVIQQIRREVSNQQNQEWDPKCKPHNGRSWCQSAAKYLEINYSLN